MAEYYKEFAEIPGASVAVGVTSTLVTLATREREEIMICNDSDTVIYLRLDATGAGVGQGIRLAPGSSPLSIYTTQKYVGPICAIHGSVGTKNLTIAIV